jgi:hypothetical protein
LPKLPRPKFPKKLIVVLLRSRAVQLLSVSDAADWLVFSAGCPLDPDVFNLFMIYLGVWAWNVRS